MIAFYLFTLGLSSGMVAAFTRHVLAVLGLMAGFESTLYFVLGIAAAYASSQLIYMCAIQAIYPSRPPGPYATESASHAAALVLLPHVLRLDIRWPHPSMDSMEPLIYAGGFVALHLVLKLSTFYAALRGSEGRRLLSVWWFAGSFACALLAFFTISSWLQQMSEASSPAPSEATDYRVGDQYARAVVMVEGSVFHQELDAYPGQRLTLRWAPLPEVTQPMQIYVTVTLSGADTKTFIASPKLEVGRWTEVGISGRFIPKDLASCTIQWSTHRVPSWFRLLGIRPVSIMTATEGGARAKVLFSGPLKHEIRPVSKGKNILLIAVDGLAADHVSMLGYARDTTPSFNLLGRRSVVFENAFTPAPEAMGAYMSLMTALDPLRHGYLSGRKGPAPSHTLPELLASARYATVAFTEGERGDLTHGSGFAQGFELFDASYSEAGSASTLNKIRTWITTNKALKFFAFVRLSELGNEENLPAESASRRFGDAGRAPDATDRYDNALAQLDGRLGALLKFVRDQDGGKNTAIIITSPYGLNPGGGVGLHEPSLRVPLLIYVPGAKASLRRDLVSTQDIAPTILAIAGVTPPRTMKGRNLLSGPSQNDPISVFGQAGGVIALSLRMEKWRYSWQSGIPLSGSSERTQPQGLGLFYYAYDDPHWWKKDLTIEYPAAVRKYTTRLTDYIRDGRSVDIRR